MCTTLIIIHGYMQQSKMASRATICLSMCLINECHLTMILTGQVACGLSSMRVYVCVYVWCVCVCGCVCVCVCVCVWCVRACMCVCAACSHQVSSWPAAPAKPSSVRSIERTYSKKSSWNCGYLCMCVSAFCTVTWCISRAICCGL